MASKRQPLRPSASEAPPSDAASIGSRRAQVNAYRDAVDPSVPVHHGDRPPETPDGHDVTTPGGEPAPTQEPTTTSYTTEAMVQLLQRLTQQVDDSRQAQEASVANLERRFSSFQESVNQTPAPDIDNQDAPQRRNTRFPDAAAAATPRHSDVQHAMREEAG
jgi:DNA-binding protein H-NS